MDFAAQYRKLYEAYHNSSDHYMTWNEFDIKANEIIQAYLDELLANPDWEQLRQTWFINYGTMNCWGWETSFRYKIACRLHVIDVRNHPELHGKVPQRYNWRCWHEDNCKCGLCSSCDSSD